jgi:hypothetical protein
MRTMGRDKWLIGIDTPQCRIHLSLDKLNANEIKRTFIDIRLGISY